MDCCDTAIVPTIVGLMRNLDLNGVAECVGSA
jgi:hypothetical protein